jgi:hypothetical protein
VLELDSVNRAQAAEEQAQVMFPSSMGWARSHTWLEIPSWASRAKTKVSVEARLGQPIVARKEKMTHLRPPRRHELSIRGGDDVITPTAPPPAAQQWPEFAARKADRSGLAGRTLAYSMVNIILY